MISIEYTDKIVGEYYTLLLNLQTDEEWIILPDGYVYETINAGDSVIRQIGAVYEVVLTKCT